MDDETSGKRFGDFEIGRELGRGGMGIVYEARQISLNRKVAFKVISQGLGLSSKAVERFRREAEAAGKLHHTNIVPIYATGVEGGTHYYAMELIQGPSLDQVIRELRPTRPSPGRPIESGQRGAIGSGDDRGDDRNLDTVPEDTAAGMPPWVSDAFGDAPPVSVVDSPPPEVSTTPSRSQSSSALTSGTAYFDHVARMIAGVADALDHAHEHGVIHRDIKPANLLLSPDARLSVNDFGLARMLEQPGMTVTGEFVGSPLYMSPEQIMAGRGKLDHRTDIYSLGATLYECLTFHPPQTGQGRDEVISKIIQKEPRPPRQYNRKIPVDLETICLKALEKDPDRRYQTAARMAEDLRRYSNRYAITAKRAGPVQRFARLVQRQKLAAGLTAGIVVVALVAGVLGWQYFAGQGTLRTERWARTQALPEIRRLVDEEKFADALDLALEAERQIPEDPNLETLWPEFSVETSITSEPDGVDVSMREWNAAGGEWRHIGTAPMDHVRLPKGQFHWKLTRKDHATLVRLKNVTRREMKFRLEKSDGLPPGMVRVGGGDTFISLSGISYVAKLPVGDFLIDRYEVTNRQFQEFVDRGGYASRQFWKNPFVKEGSTLSWEEAMARLVDMTGVPGPAVWKSGRYPDGQDDYPVRGVSWFEAAAYAEFAGKRLPSVYHWDRAADLWGATYIVPLSNFDREAPAPVGRYRGVGGRGAFDMAGNVKEWCQNSAGAGERYILGGAWDEPKFMFNDPDDQPAFARSENYGFRCVKILSGGETSPRVDDEIVRHRREFSAEKPVSDEEFEIYRRYYSYDKDPLNEKVLLTRESESYSYEKIEFDAAYGSERVTVHFYRPAHVEPPYQTVIYFPPGYTLGQRKFDDAALNWQIAFIVENGRAVLYPVYKGTFERESDLKTTVPAATTLYKDHLIAWSKDLGRSIDYLEKRPDVEREKLAYYGYSWGAALGAILPAVEKRLKVAVLSGAGLSEPETFPEVSQINFAPRVTIPVLMLSGRYNSFFPVETTVAPMFRLLGTPEADKRLQTFESGHFIPGKDLTRELVAWFDKYLGPVRLRAE